MASESTLRLVNWPTCIVYREPPLETCSSSDTPKFSIRLKTTFITRRRPPSEDHRCVAGVETTLRVPAEDLDAEAVSAVLSIGGVPEAVTRSSLNFVVAKVLAKARRAMDFVVGDGKGVLIPLTVVVILIVDRIPQDLCANDKDKS